MIQLTGTEKQVKWAEDIRKIYFENIEVIKDAIENINKRNKNFTPVYEAIENQEEAKFWIDYFQSLTAKHCTNPVKEIKNILKILCDNKVITDIYFKNRLLKADLISFQEETEKFIKEHKEEN